MPHALSPTIVAVDVCERWPLNGTLLEPIEEESSASPEAANVIRSYEELAARTS
jgi:hypothetical protein